MKAETDRDVTRKQQQLLTCLRRGTQLRMALQECGLTNRDIATWQRTDPAFRKAFRETFSTIASNA